MAANRCRLGRGRYLYLIRGFCLQDVLSSLLPLLSTLVFRSLGYQGPGRSYILVGQRHRSSARSGSLNEILQPEIFACSWLFHTIHISQCSLDQYRTQLTVADLLAQAHELRLATAALLPRRQPKVGSGLTTLGKGSTGAKSGIQQRQ